MFTGLIEVSLSFHHSQLNSHHITLTFNFNQQSIGTVQSLTSIKPDASDPWSSSLQLTITEASKVLSDCQLGDSIAINGTCLTVLSFDHQTFTVGIAPETLRRTNLGLSLSLSLYLSIIFALIYRLIFVWWAL